MRPCHCNRATSGPYAANQCRPCWLALNDARYQRLWGLPVQTRTTKPAPRHQVRTSPTSEVRVRFCASRGVWDWSATVAGRVVAQGSEPTEAEARSEARAALGEPPLPPIPVGADSPRHLLYHVMPVRGNGVWQWNLDRLRCRLDLFTGRRIVAVVRSPGCDDADGVKEHLRDCRIDEWIVRDNDPSLREVVTWFDLWERVAGLPGYVWYGHAKGVTRPVNRSVSVHRWASLHYAAGLDYWPHVATILKRHPIAGCLKKIGPVGGTVAPWHYTGSFFWVRLADLGERWKKIERHWWANECWPGLHWSAAEAGTIFGEGSVKRLNVYDMRTISRLEEEYDRWRLHIRSTTTGIS